LGFGIGGLHEHTAELLEGFWVVNHLSGSLHDGGKSAPSVGLPLAGVLGVFVPETSQCSFAEWLRLNVAEI
jgi:hypothetical protein